MAKSGAKWSKKTTKWMEGLQKGCYIFNYTPLGVLYR